MVQVQVFQRVRLEDRRGLGNPGVQGWGLSHPPRTYWEAIPSAGRIFVILSFKYSVRSFGLGQWFTNLAAH